MSLKRFVKDTAIYGIATVLPRVITVLLVGLFTHHLKTNQFSEATEFWIFAALFNVLLTYGMETAFFRFFTKLKEDKKVISTAFTSILTTSLIALVLLLSFRIELSSILQINNVTYITFLILITIIDTIVVIPYAYLRVTNRPIRFAFYKIFNVLIYLFVIILLFEILPAINKSQLFDNYFSVNSKVTYIFISQLIASSITLFLFVPTLSRIKIGIDKKILKQMLIYSLPIMIAGVAYIINENADKILIKNMLGKDTMGAYGASYKIGVFMTLFITAFRLGAEPFFFNQSKEKDAKQKYATILLWFTIVGAVFYVAIVANMDIIASILLRQKDYYSAIGIVPIILLANLMLGIYHNLAVWYKLTDRTKYGMYLSIFGAIITIVLNIIFIPKIGIMASAWATVAAYGSMMITSYFIGRKYYFVPYKVGKIMLYLGVSTVLSFIIFNYFYDYFFIKNLIVLAFIALISIIEKKEIKQIIKKT